MHASCNVTGRVSTSNLGQAKGFRHQRCVCQYKHICLLKVMTKFNKITQKCSIGYLKFGLSLMMQNLLENLDCVVIILNRKYTVIAQLGYYEICQ